MVLVTERALLRGEEARFGPVGWKSQRVKRVVNSSMGGESLVLMDGLGDLEYAMCLWLEMVFPDFSYCRREEFYPLLETGHNSFYVFGDCARLVDGIRKEDCDQHCSDLDGACFAYAARPEVVGATTVSGHNAKT